MSWDLSTDDLDAAVRHGVIDAAARDRLVLFARSRRAGEGDIPEGETFRLLTGFNDIFVSIGIVLTLGALGTLAGIGLGLLLVLLAAWGLAEYFTRVRRLALSSIVLLVGFVLSAFFWTGALLSGPEGLFSSGHESGVIIASAAAMLAAAAHWWRFRVPVTVAAGFAAFGAAVIAAVHQVNDTVLSASPAYVFLPLGLAAFALALGFDMSDRDRLTRRTDTAFWLHLLAAPAIVHSALWSIVTKGDLGATGAAMVITLFCVLSVVALVVDRRAILVSSLSYLIYALGTLMSSTRELFGSYAFSALVAGGIVLLLSVAWQSLRSALMAVLPQAITGLMPPAAAELKVRAAARP